MIINNLCFSCTDYFFYVTLQKKINNMQGIKEIHFYKDVLDVDKDKHKMFYTHNGTIEAIERNEKIIHTFAISSLDFSNLLERNYVIVLHENGLSGICHEGTTCLTDKELRKGHDIRRIWIGGGFNGYFYANTQIQNPYKHE